MTENHELRPVDPPSETSQLYRHDISGVLASGIISQKVYDKAFAQVKEAFGVLRQKGAEGELPMLESAFWHDDLAHFQSTGMAYRRFEHILVIGTGGSSLGGRALVALFQSWVKSDSSFPLVHFLDNLDPEIFWEMMSLVDPSTTGVLVISKSGETPETLIQLMRCIEYWQAFLSTHEFGRHITVITENKPNSLLKIAKKFRLPTLSHPETIGGRFSCLTLVGLLPVMIVGGDPRKVREGAGHLLNQVFAEENLAPLEGVAVQWALYKEKHVSSHVLFPYGDAFHPFGEWYRQLWAESLGKGGQGFTPMTSMGPLDQHSQLQLYLDGPKDKFMTFLSEGQLPREQPKPDMWEDFPELNYLAYASIENLVQAQQAVTIQALLERGMPVRTLSVTKLNESTIGALFAHFMIETLLMGLLLEVNPLTQDAVDALKGVVKRFLLNPSAIHKGHGQDEEQRQVS